MTGAVSALRELSPSLFEAHKWIEAAGEWEEARAEPEKYAAEAHRNAVENEVYDVTEEDLLAVIEWSRTVQAPRKWSDKVVDMGLFSKCLARALSDPDVLPEFDRLTGFDLCMKRSAIEQAIDKATGHLDAGVETFLHFVVDAIYLPVQMELLETTHEE